MFRKITNSAPSKQPLQRKEKFVRKEIIGGVTITKSVSFENPQQRVEFDKYSLKDLLATGVKQEQVNTKVIDNFNFDSLNDVSRETSTGEPEEVQPF